MSTITIYKNKINGVSEVISDLISSANNIDSQLYSLKSTLQGVSGSSYNIQDMTAALIW